MVKMGTVWDRTAEFLTDNLPAILPIALLAFFVPFSIQGSFKHVIMTGSDQLALILSLVSVGVGVLALWGSLAMTAMALDLADGRTAGSLAGRRLIPALVVQILLVVIVCVTLIPFVLAFRGHGDDPIAIVMAILREETSGLSLSMSLPLGIYMIVLVPALLWFAARFSVLVSTIVVAEKKMFGALARSFELTRGVALKIIGVLLLYGIVASVAALAAQLVFGSIFQLIAGPPTGGLSLSQVLTSVIVATVQTGFTVIAPVFTAKLYLALTADRARAAAA